MLAARARELASPALVAGLDAADRAADARRAWLAAARVWDTMVTDTRDYLSRAAAEAGHLALAMAVGTAARKIGMSAS